MSLREIENHNFDFDGGRRRKRWIKMMADGETEEDYSKSKKN